MFEIVHPDYESTFRRQGFLKEGQKSQTHSWYRNTPRFLNLMIFYFSISLTNNNFNKCIFRFLLHAWIYREVVAKVSALDAEEEEQQ